MKIKILVVLILLLLIPIYSYSFETKILGINNFKKIEWDKFIIGAISSIVIHELGHIITMEIVGADYEFINPVSFKFSDNGISNEEAQWIARSGMLVQNVTGIILTSINNKSSFTKGYNFSSFISTITYPVRNQNNGDLKTLKKYGANSGLEYSIFSAIAFINLVTIEW